MKNTMKQDARTKEEDQCSRPAVASRNRFRHLFRELGIEVVGHRSAVRKHYQSVQRF